MPKLDDESDAEFLDRLCAMDEDAAEEELDEVDVEVRSKERKRRRDEKKEAERKAKEAKEEADRKAREEEAARKAKAEDKKKRKAEKAAKEASEASGSGAKAKGKEKETRKASAIDVDDEEEAPAEKKAKKDPCVHCAKQKLACAVRDTADGRSRRACEACHTSKVRCEWVSDADGASATSVVSAIHDLAESNEGGFLDLFTQMREANGTLNDLLKVGVALLQDRGDTGIASAKKITDSRERRKAQWTKEDADRDREEGSSKGKK
ncbi:hypothetical protein DFH08DRAFT_979464 [Mycena albidolilacea]|uniref:Zn(2)-C6 fungal-type domain-containing protein n=1 Tax=Mycena albidolilacea TaxID=1033008 RepID=A0AAD6YX51_9AGAR|nr:hypothetical protein DFH08DRAFT_979464 [Mycena albidolilacea]